MSSHSYFGNRWKYGCVVSYDDPRAASYNRQYFGQVESSQAEPRRRA